MGRPLVPPSSSALRLWPATFGVGTKGRVRVCGRGFLAMLKCSTFFTRLAPPGGGGGGLQDEEEEASTAGALGSGGGRGSVLSRLAISIPRLLPPGAIAASCSVRCMANGLLSALCGERSLFSAGSAFAMDLMRSLYTSCPERVAPGAGTAVGTDDAEIGGPGVTTGGGGGAMRVLTRLPGG